MLVCVFIDMQLEVVEIALDQSGPSNERKIALIDKNRDLYVTSVRHLGRETKICKLGETGRRKLMWQMCRDSLFLPTSAANTG